MKYKISSSIAQYTSSIMTYSEVWESYCDEVNISYTTSGENIYFYGDLTVDASTIEKNEVIVHEVGHALGLAHCQTAKNAISVMRAKGFNNKAYPLSDDIKGISNLY